MTQLALCGNTLKKRPSLEDSCAWSAFRCVLELEIYTWKSMSHIVQVNLLQGTLSGSLDCRLWWHHCCKSSRDWNQNEHWLMEWDPRQPLLFWTFINHAVSRGGDGAQVARPIGGDLSIWAGVICHMTILATKTPAVPLGISASYLEFWVLPIKFSVQDSCWWFHGGC